MLLVVIVCRDTGKQACTLIGQTTHLHDGKLTKALAWAEPTWKVYV